MMQEFASQYLHLLKTKLAGLNLTNILEEEEFFTKQILDSINPYQQSTVFQQDLARTNILVDVGFGGGFPLLPLAKLLPQYTFVGIESKRKKVDAVKLIADELGLKNVLTVHSRIEDFQFNRPATVTFKAVGTIGDFLPKIHHQGNLKVFFYKGPNFLDLEGDQIKKLEPSWKMVENLEISVPGTLQRSLASFSSKIVPRGTAKVLVKLTDFL